MSDYDVIVIGAGAAGLTAAILNGEIGRRVALIERDRIGGDCTWTGCVPSKALLRVARAAHEIRQARRFGIAAQEPVVDMVAVRAHLRTVIESVYAHETPEAVRARGVDVRIGQAQFLDAHRVQVGDQILRAKKFIVATGARAMIPPIAGLEQVPYRTNHDFFENDRLPRHLLIVGAGPIGMEMGQAYARLGAQVTIIASEIMPTEDPDAVRVLRHVFAAEGITIVESGVRSAAAQSDEITLTLQDGATVQGDLLLVATGRAPNVDGLNLDAAGVRYSAAGIAVNEYLRTSVPHIYAVGDVTTGAKFTHYAGFQGAVAGQNALLPAGRRNGHVQFLPRVTFTEPQLAQVGMSEEQARQRYGDGVKVSRMPLSQGDRSIAEMDSEGFIKLVYRGSSELLGATVVGNQAGEMVMEYQLVIQKKLTARALVGVMHPYPTYADVVKKALARMLVHELQASRFAQNFRRLMRLLP